MGVILFFVFRSLARQLRKVNEAARLEALQSDADAQQSGAQQSGAQRSGAQPAGTTLSGAPQADAEGSSPGRPLADSKVIGPPAPNGRAR
jgi:hypothetical protein